jgi:hypothetical protein
MEPKPSGEVCKPLGRPATRIRGTGGLWFDSDERPANGNLGLGCGLMPVTFGRASMIKLLGAAAILSMVTMPALAHARHHRHIHHQPLISYLHNYGPGPSEGSYAYYDGPLRANCKQGAAAYLGQDGRGHPCL